MHNTNASYTILFENIANTSTIITTTKIKISSKMWERKKNNKETSFSSQTIRKNGNKSIEIGINLKRERNVIEEKKGEWLCDIGHKVVRIFAWV